MRYDSRRRDTNVGTLSTSRRNWMRNTHTHTHTHPFLHETVHASDVAAHPGAVELSVSRVREGLGLVVLLWVQEHVGEGAFFQASWPDDTAVRALAEVLFERVCAKHTKSDERAAKTEYKPGSVLLSRGLSLFVVTLNLDAIEKNSVPARASD